MNSNSTSSVHCGFYNFNGGFRISDDDKIYMKTCQAVVSTCAFGGGDDIYQPIGMTAASLDKVFSYTSIIYLYLNSTCLNSKSQTYFITSKSSIAGLLCSILG